MHEADMVRTATFPVHAPIADNDAIRPATPPEVQQAREFELGVRVNINQVAPGYFRTLGIPLLQGRDFTDRDRTGAPGVVIVSRKLAEKMWQGGSQLLEDSECLVLAPPHTSF
jgi:hypothetical protein